MASYGRRRRRSRRGRRTTTAAARHDSRKPRETQSNKCLEKLEEAREIEVEVEAEEAAYSKLSENNSLEVSIDLDNGCSTPRGQRFRIPEINTCPPAPKKRRVVSSSNCSLHRTTPINFFVPPELEDLFFLFALPNISV